MWSYTSLPGHPTLLSVVMSIEVSHPYPAQSHRIHQGSSHSPCSVLSCPSRSVTPTLLGVVIYIATWSPPPHLVLSYTLGSAKLTLLSPIIYISTWSPPPYLVPSYALTSVLLTPLEAVSYPSILHLDTLYRAFYTLCIYMLDGPGHVLRVSYISGLSQYHPYMSGVLQAGSPYATGECDCIM